MSEPDNAPKLNADAEQTAPWLRRTGLIAGVVFFALTRILPPPEGMDSAAWVTCGLALWMAAWWITEAAPLPVTALLPLVVLPVLDVMPLRKASANFAADLIFLFLGGFILSIGIRKWRVHERIGLGLLRHCGRNLPTLLAGLLLVTGFMGMWMSNAATAMVMMPMAISIGALVERGQQSGGPASKALLLGVAYAPCLGGLATFVGTPTNAVLEGFVAKTYGVELSLAQWMKFGVPVAVTLLVCCWALLYVTLLRRVPSVDGLGVLMDSEYRRLGSFSRGEAVTTAVFAGCILCWMFSGVIADVTGVKLDDAVVAIAAALLLFLLPLGGGEGRTALTWRDAEGLPWGILIFFGGSLSLSAALTETGVTRWLSNELQILQGVPLWLVASAVVVLVVVVSEMMSNSATVSAFLPILAGLCGGLGVHPFLVMIPATLAASCAFMMPGASPPNAIAFSTGSLRVGEMVRTGLLLNLVCAAVILLAAFHLIPVIMGFDPLTVPEWAKGRR
jgi:solute carrier family 13 (sodium-dependent dicarboxylate transporter), member 2/3/5